MNAVGDGERRQKGRRRDVPLLPLRSSLGRVDRALGGCGLGLLSLRSGRSSGGGVHLSSRSLLSGGAREWKCPERRWARAVTHRRLSPALSSDWDWLSAKVVIELVASTMGGVGIASRGRRKKVAGRVLVLSQDVSKAVIKGSDDGRRTSAERNWRAA